ncbi:hypothetical protein [Mycobacterium sp.]|uniref:hypothetical protein n=1 Tax=Mycobacterium sp. TaxID=1785 RepID=UPI003BAB404B
MGQINHTASTWRRLHLPRVGELTDDIADDSSVKHLNFTENALLHKAFRLQ